MKEQIEQFLNDWADGKKDKEALKSIYLEISGQEIEKCHKCETKALTAIRKYYHLTFQAQNTELEKNKDREFVLAPGLHQLAPGEKAMHTNSNTTDEQLKWYLDNFPGTKANFIKGV